MAHTRRFKEIDGNYHIRANAANPLKYLRAPNSIRSSVWMDFSPSSFLLFILSIFLLRLRFFLVLYSDSCMCVLVCVCSCVYNSEVTGATFLRTRVITTHTVRSTIFHWMLVHIMLEMTLVPTWMHSKWVPVKHLRATREEYELSVFLRRRWRWQCMNRSFVFVAGKTTCRWTKFCIKCCRGAEAAMICVKENIKLPLFSSNFK